jgi:hypothetical protein
MRSLQLVTTLTPMAICQIVELLALPGSEIIHSIIEATNSSNDVQVPISQKTHCGCITKTNYLMMSGVETPVYSENIAKKISTLQIL